MPWLLNEDAALKFKLQGMTVTDATSPPNGRKVKVRYRLPETEVANLDYPCIILEFLGAFGAPEREHRSGPINLPYTPEGYSGPGPFRVPWYPIPYNLDYQVTVLSRLARDHHFPLLARMQMPDKLPYHWGQIIIPQDNTVRTMILSGGPDTPYGVDEDGKRLFTAVYRVRIFSELYGPVTDLSPGNYPRVSQLNIDLGVYEDASDLTTEELSQSFGMYSLSMQSAWQTMAS